MKMMEMENFQECNNININEVCRICLTKQDEMNLISDYGIAGLLVECTLIQLFEEDLLHYVCDKCTNELSHCYIFKQQVKRSFEIGHWLLLKEKKDEIENENNPKEVIIVDDEEISNQNRTEISCNENFVIEHVSQSENTQKSRKSTSHAKTHFCARCNHEFNKWQDLTKHMRQHVKEYKKSLRIIKEHKCETCGKLFNSTQNLRNHAQRHDENLRKYACDQCDKRFYKSYDLKMHSRIHSGEKPYKCTYCNKDFTRPVLLRTHIKQRHTSEKHFICQVCEKAFVNAWLLKVHSRIHTGEKPHTCLHCDKTFAFQSNLSSHIRYKHTFEKNFLCSVCAKSFTEKHSMLKHMKTHKRKDDESKYECPFSLCGKICHSSSILEYHVQVHHNDEKSFTCYMCSKDFTSKYDLTDHLRSHTGERPLSCPICGKTFSSSSLLSIHKRTHVNKKSAIRDFS